MIDPMELRKLNGWMSKTGEIAECAPLAHYKTAKELADKDWILKGLADQSLIDGGWVKIVVSWKSVHLFYRDLRNLTNKQRKKIGDMIVDYHLSNIYANDFGMSISEFLTSVDNCK